MWSGVNTHDPNLNFGSLRCGRIFASVAYIRLQNLAKSTSNSRNLRECCIFCSFLRAKTSRTTRLLHFLKPLESFASLWALPLSNSKLYLSLSLTSLETLPLLKLYLSPSLTSLWALPFSDLHLFLSFTSFWASSLPELHLPLSYTSFTVSPNSSPHPFQSRLSVTRKF